MVSAALLALTAALACLPNRVAADRLTLMDRVDDGAMRLPQLAGVGEK